MSDFSFLAVPNIQGMRLAWYIQIFGIVLLFGICLFFVFYFWIAYRKKQILSHHLDDVGQQTEELYNHLLIQNIKKSSGKTKLILFIEYLEKFVTNKTYANVSDLLSFQGFTPKELKICEQVIYTHKKLPEDLETKIDEILRDK